MLPKIVLSIVVFSVLTAKQAISETAADLRAQIVKGGTHETEKQRNSVSVDRCVMTTERWLNRPEHGWVLWSSFQFNMWNAELA